MGLTLTRKELEICQKYSARDENNEIHCKECPLNLSDIVGKPGVCYRNVNLRLRIVRDLKRYEDD